VGKGRDVGLQQLYKFEAKLAQGAAMQCLSRDVYRLGHSLDFFRLLSFYFGGLGFYINNSLCIYALYLFIYARLLLACAHYDDPFTFSGYNPDNLYNPNNPDNLYNPNNPDNLYNPNKPNRGTQRELLDRPDGSSS
jgi:hypothetical protein